WKKIDNTWVSSLGFCGTWCLWYIDLRLSFPDKEPKVLLRDVYKILLSKENKYSKFIENYDYEIYLREHELRKKLPKDPEKIENYIMKLTASFGKKINRR